MRVGRSGWRVIGPAVALAALFTLAWTIRAWADLTRLRLPDTDDVVRLQEIRDWLSGQAFGDLTQYRFGANGLAMHWSRLADLVPGGLIAALTPLVGRHAAEVSAVIAWPAALFATALALTGRIARVQLVSGPTAMLVAALGFPATAMFLPGRIDHHGLQLVLLLGMVAALLYRRGAASGTGVALGGVASLTVGLETAPFVAVAVAVVVLGWIAERPGAARHLAALALSLGGGLIMARLVFAPASLAYPACDGFTGEVWRAELIGSAGLIALTGLGPVVVGRGARVLLVIGIGGISAVVALAAAPDCVDPYGGVDPLLAARWLANVGEAQSPFAAPLATTIGQCGLMLAGIAAGLWALHRTRDPGWAILLLFQGCALAISLVQLRGANAGALLAAPALAWGIAAARKRGALAVAAAWLVSAGIVYPLVAEAVVPPRPATNSDPAGCASPAALAALGRLPPGLVAGPVDLGAWGLAATRHRFLAAPYHRNNRGNAAAFRIADGPAPVALPVVLAAGVTYVAACGPSGAWIARDRPAWLEPRLQAGALRVYAVRADRSR